MQDFFDPPPHEPERERHEPPIWLEPPSDELAALVPDRRLLARTDGGVVLLLSHIDAFSQGCLFRIRASAQRRDQSSAAWWDLHELFLGGPRYELSRRGGDGLPDELLRFGVRFADGSKATTTGGAWLPHRSEEPPEGHVLVEAGGGGGGDDRFVTSSTTLWLWPLPPAESFELVYEWPAFGVLLDRIALDGAALVDAAARSRPLWPAGQP